MKNIFETATFIICILVSLNGHSQNWESTSLLDTTRHTSGKVWRVQNIETLDEIRYSYDDTGNLRTSTFVTFRNGVQYDKVSEYYSNGNISRQYFCYNVDKVFYGIQKKDSTQTEYCDNGMLKAKYFYKDNKLNGKTIYYHPNGLVYTELDYIDDRLMNACYYDLNGKLMEQGSFKDGNGELIIYKEGNKVSICKYSKGKQKSCRTH